MVMMTENRIVFYYKMKNYQTTLDIKI